MRAAWSLLAVAAVAGLASAQTVRVADARRTLADLNAKEAVLAARIGENRAALARLLGALERFSRDPPPALLVSPSDARDAVRAAILVRAITPELEARARALSGEAATLALARRRAAEASGDLFAAESALEDRAGRLEAVAGDADELSPPGARKAASALDLQAAPTTLLRPAAGPLAAGFGGRLRLGGRSRGLVIRTAPDALVLSPAAAVVVFAGPLEGWGRVVILRGGGGCHIVLSGLGKVSVAPGQSVAAGQIVGAMISDGQSASELYFEVRMGGAPVDPAPFVGGPPARTAATLGLRGAVGRN